MPSTLKDALSGATTAGSAQNDAQGSQPSTAAGAEIPVTVHASRYSAAGKGGAKLPPVHEETRTVIILPQGAVVRLSATVTPGELVVLTNNRTGADVICRVTDVKTQPGIQNYVHLEFTQRALDFWEEAAAGRVNSLSKSPAGAPSTPTPKSAAIGVRNSPIQEIQSPAPRIPGQGMDVPPVSAALPKITPLADPPAKASAEAHVNSTAAESQVSESTLAPAAAQRQPSAPAPRSPRLQPFEPAISESKNTSKNVVLFAIAAVVLLGIGVVAGSVLLRQDRGTMMSQQLWNPRPAAAAPVSAPSESEAPIVNTSGKANPSEVPATIPARNPLPETPVEPPAPIRATAEPLKPVVQPKPVIRPNINVGKISAPKLKTAAQVNSSEPPPVLPVEANPFAGVIGESAGNTARVNPALPAPAPPAPVKGGQMQQPKLLSSVSAVYPPLAHTQHVQGDVVIDALVDATGKVAATNVISGNSLLQKSAVDALRLWKYQPALLNGEPIPIHIKVTIAFHLN